MILHMEKTGKQEYWRHTACKVVITYLLQRSASSHVRMERISDWRTILKVFFFCCIAMISQLSWNEMLQPYLCLNATHMKMDILTKIYLLTSNTSLMKWNTVQTPYNKMACDQKIILFLEVVVVQRFSYDGRQWLSGRTTGSFRIWFGCTCDKTCC